ncbi:MAG: LysM peptidoglycan-binding domain-containing protein [Chloroflexi bacterium]|nr:LysM peptidoglycan-binding domain-containing protein [Chloroflexota bacterium]
MTLLSACTRERPPLPTIDAAQLLSASGGVPAFTPIPTVLPAFTPHTTPAPPLIEPSEPLENAATPTPQIDEEAAPSTPEQAPANTPEPEQAVVTYVVKRGDTLYSIALQFGVSMQALRAINQIDDPTTLRAGRELLIPIQAGRGGYVHVVKPGETLYGIAKQYNVPLDKLAEANGITDPTTLRVGQRLIIPSAASSSGQSGGQRIHVVRPGETLTSIAAQYGVSPAAIIEANDLDNPNEIISGQQLIIP